MCPRGIGASHGKAAPCPGWWGHGAPHKTRPRGAVQGSACAHLLWTWPTPSSAHTRKLTCAHTFVRTAVYAVLCACAHACHVHVCTHALVCVCSYVHTRVHTHAHSTRTCMGLFTCTCTLVCSHTLLCTRPTHTPARAALQAHAHLTAWTLISHLHPSHVHTDTCSGTWPHPSLPSTGPAHTL